MIDTGHITLITKENFSNFSIHLHSQALIGMPHLVPSINTMHILDTPEKEALRLYAKPLW